ncbi:MAG: rhomboid family intramembrane serine protease [Patescibacteria group bacterium]
MYSEDLARLRRRKNKMNSGEKYVAHILSQLVYLSWMLIILDTRVSNIFFDVYPTNVLQTWGSLTYELFWLEHEYWRVIVAPFIHQSFWHMLMSLIGLYSIFMIAEEIYGVKHMIFSTLITLIIAFAGGALFGSQEIYLGMSMVVIMAVGMYVAYHFYFAPVLDLEYYEWFLIVGFTLILILAEMLRGHTETLMCGCFTGVMYGFICLHWEL